MSEQIILGKFPVNKDMSYNHYTLKVHAKKYHFRSIFDFRDEVANWARENDVDVKWSGFWTESYREDGSAKFYSLSFNCDNPHDVTMLCLRWS